MAVTVDCMCHTCGKEWKQDTEEVLRNNGATCPQCFRFSPEVRKRVSASGTGEEEEALFKETLVAPQEIGQCLSCKCTRGGEWYGYWIGNFADYSDIAGPNYGVRTMKSTYNMLGRRRTFICNTCRDWKVFSWYAFSFVATIYLTAPFWGLYFFYDFLSGLPSTIGLTLFWGWSGGTIIGLGLAVIYSASVQKIPGLFARASDVMEIFAIRLNHGRVPDFFIGLGGTKYFTQREYDKLKTPGSA